MLLSGNFFLISKKRRRPVVLASVMLTVGAALALAAQTQSPAGYHRREVIDQNAYLYYTGVKTIVDEPPAELKHKYLELKHLQPAQSQAELPLILQKLGKNIALVFQNFPNTSCRETIREVRLTNDRTVGQSLVQVFNYIILPVSSQGSETFREYRTNSKGRIIDPSKAFGATLTTIGFASMPLVFLPRYQPQSRFRYLGQDQIKHRDVDVVAYAQIFSKAEEMGYVDIGGRTALILTQGVAWIDPQTFQILRMRTDLLAPRPDILLDRQTTDIEFSTVKFKKSLTTLWLPQQVTVDVAWNNLLFENTHTYSHFRLFNVQTDQSTSAASPPRKP